jgi:hypothetical protein
MNDSACPTAKSGFRPFCIRIMGGNPIRRAARLSGFFIAQLDSRDRA